MTEPIPQLLTLAAVAKALCVARIPCELDKKGRLRPIRLCRRLLFHPSEIARFLTGSKSECFPEQIAASPGALLSELKRKWAMLHTRRTETTMQGPRLRLVPDRWTQSPGDYQHCGWGFGNREKPITVPGRHLCRCWGSLSRSPR